MMFLKFTFIWCPHKYGALKIGVQVRETMQRQCFFPVKALGV
eukprot:UN07546